MAMRRNRSREEKHDILDVTASMQGSLVFSDPVNLRISGKFAGKLETKGALLIADTAEVEAEIFGEFIEIAGRVKGIVHATKQVKMIPPAIFDGHLYTSSLVVEDGAVIEGECHMLNNELMSPQEIAEYLKVDVDSIYKWAQDGTMPARRINTAWLFDRREIDSWIAQGGSSFAQN